jgi:putative addiction module component (TIGR02574 family)
MGENKEISLEAAQILERALELSAHDRGGLAARLIESLDEGPPDEGVEEAWEAEIQRRLDDLESGKAKTIPWEEVQQRALARLRDREE